MAIPRSMVAGGTVVLAEFFAVTGNASTVACRILGMLPPDSDSGSAYPTTGTSFTSSWPMGSPSPAWPTIFLFSLMICCSISCWLFLFIWLKLEELDQSFCHE
ncbi:hypothetical protein MUK42_30854 [Musa troglodytarum]|uniref:Uncharacterized protein n=1 Tax=Musa troglodytarum TaxID=320322 RepID=A0A9E7JYS6_9LILI|nr:hypothetical protein MUK42_30854 [Musa troglodytarum]